ncbi:mucin-5AC-like isoform X2 [Mizuhopecten yessoensis]|uniref:mucin-5AC-like isoform X2 n=1 Tax=Mizuhopecten yessoensis TaxID=6573 RepID=UPI000B45DE34|nr:mucin-5AC-like isoform X2 [Mizuhopecten yessoensis]
MAPPELGSPSPVHFLTSTLLDSFCDWMETGMESDISEHLETDEMYMMLQADMLSIKRQETDLKSEIVEITSKFKNILTSCGIEPQDYSIVNQSSGSLPPTPTFMRSSALTQVSALSSDEDFLLQEMMKASLCSTSSDSIYEDSAMTLIVDSNSNYMSLPKNDIVSNPNIPNVTGSSSSDISNGSVGANTSDGYPKSPDTSSDDNQCVPECLDLEQERMSRMQYYGDFTIDRQRRIDNMTMSLSSGPVCTNLTSAATEELFTREVEGCEDNTSVPAVRLGPIIGACLPPSTYSTTTSGSASSTPSSGRPRRRHSSRKNRTSSSKGSSNKYISIPCASSTMIEDLSPSSSSSGSSKHRSSSIPRASSTMIDDPDTPCSSEDDLQSIYTWSIHDNGCDEDLALEESYFRNLNQHQKITAKPPLPPKRVLSSSSSSSRSSSRRSSKRDNLKAIPSNSCTLPIDALSVIEPSASYRDAYLGSESMYDDDDIPFKSNSLPRTSTRIQLLPNKSSGSSMEARCSSMPDIISVDTANNDDFHSVPTSPDHSADNTSPLGERLELPGKSSSSSASPVSDNQCSASHPNTDALVDSILTDSPTSVCSSGIFVPCNTPDVTDHSKTSRSTTSDKSDSRAQPVAPLSSVPSVPSNTQTDSGLFKVPRFNQPLKKLFRFKRSKAQRMLTSTPSPVCPSSVQSDPLSKRKLFTTDTTNSADVQIVNKRAVIKKFKRFSASFNRKDRQGLTRIQTLANL